MPGLGRRSRNDLRSSPISGPSHPRSFRILFSCLRILLAEYTVSTKHPLQLFSHFRTFAKQSQKQESSTVPRISVATAYMVHICMCRQSSSSHSTKPGSFGYQSIRPFTVDSTYSGNVDVSLGNLDSCTPTRMRDRISEYTSRVRMDEYFDHQPYITAPDTRYIPARLATSIASAIGERPSPELRRKTDKRPWPLRRFRIVYAGSFFF